MEMDVARWQRIQDLFHQAVDLPPAEWTSFLRSACPDPELAREVLAMVQEDTRDAGLLDGGVGEIARQMIDAEGARPPVPRIGPYEIEDLLGEGGMGVVFRARRRDVGSVVAIKFLKDAALSPARRDRFFREQRLLAQLNHPGIAQLYDAGVLLDRTPYFVMEFVEGAPITAYCRARGSAIADRLRLFRQACEAVQYAHRQLVVHRDLKPSNILVTSAGQVKLLDFGISKRLAGSASPVTRSGLPLMTPAYASPEQLDGQEPNVDSDVYSLGLVLYELLAERLPFDLPDPPTLETIRQRLERDPERPSTRGGSAAARARGETLTRTRWADLDVMTTVALQRDRARRYPGVEPLIRDIDHYHRNEPLEARRAGWSYRARKYVERNRRWMSGAAGGLALLVAVVTVYTVRLKRAKDAAVHEVQRTKRIERFMFDLFDSGDHTAGVDKDLRALTLVERGLRTVDAMRLDPPVQADLHAALGNIYRRLGDLGRADQLLQLALTRRLDLLGRDAPETTESQLDLALLRAEQARAPEAEELARAALAVVTGRRPRDPLELARASATLGKVLETRGQYDHAVSVLEEAIRLFAMAAPETAEHSAALVTLSNVHFYAGHFDPSWSLMQRALALDLKLHGPQHPTVSSDYFDLGVIRAEMGYYADALPYYWKGLAITKAWYGETANQTAADTIVIARALDKLGRRDEAWPLATQALEIRERLLGKVHPMVASVVNELGRMAREAGRFDEATRQFDRVLAIYRQAYPQGDHYLVGLAYANRGTVALEQKHWSEAEADLRRALAIYGGTLSPDHLNPAVAHVKLGRALLGEVRLSDALAESLRGYQVLAKRASPSEWIKMAREDLAEEYRTLGRPEEARPYLTALATEKGRKR